jgi:hypothetical protein
MMEFSGVIISCDTVAVIISKYFLRFYVLSNLTIYVIFFIANISAFNENIVILSLLISNRDVASRLYGYPCCPSPLLGSKL